MPGLSHTPKADKGEISFNPDELETYLSLTKGLRDFLNKYDEEAQMDPMKFEDCGGKFLYCTQPHKPTKSLAMFLSLRRHQNGNSLTSHSFVQRTLQIIKTGVSWRATWESGRPAASPGLCLDPALAWKTANLDSRKANPA